MSLGSHNARSETSTPERPLFHRPSDSKLEEGLDTGSRPTASSWNIRRCLAETHHNWITDVFSNCDVSFELKGEDTVRRIGSRLVDEQDHRSEHNLEWPFTATAVFNYMHVVAGMPEPTSAICKGFMQIPDAAKKSDETKPCHDLPGFTRREIEALDLITRDGGDDLPGPRYLASTVFTQSTNIQLLDLGILHRDPALKNLIWNSDADKCYIIDYETSKIVLTRNKAPKKNFNIVWETWDLMKNMRGQDEEP